MGDAVFLAKAIHRFPAFSTKSGFKRTGLVVKAGMNHATVVSGLVSTETGFRLEKDKTQSGISIEQSICHGGANDPSADDGDVVQVIAHREFPTHSLNV